MALPERRPHELETEALIGRYYILVAEGMADARYLGKWFEGLGWNVSAIALTELDLAGVVFSPSAFGSNRRKVAELAHNSETASRVRFLIDRDLGVEDDIQLANSLLVTDFPSLETYALSERVLTALLIHLNRATYGSTRPEARRRELAAAVQALVATLARFLAPLYRLRLAHAQLSDPPEFVTDLRKFRRPSADGLDITKICAAVGLRAPDEEESDLSATSCVEVRPVAYGHDIARVIWAIWPDLRSRDGILNSDQVEALLLSLVAADDLLEYPLFQTLRAWAA
jgi:hypothetical protein